MQPTEHGRPNDLSRLLDSSSYWRVAIQRVVRATLVVRASWGIPISSLLDGWTRNSARGTVLQKPMVVGLSGLHRVFTEVESPGQELRGEGPCFG